MLAHNSVDRGIMARDSIELTQYDDVVSTRGKPRSSSSLKSTQHSAPSHQPDQERSHNRRAVSNEEDSELLINREDFELDELDGEEQFLRTERRVPVRRGPIPKKAASQLKIAGMIVAMVVVCGGLWKWAEFYGKHSWRFRIQSSDAVEISGVRNASRAQVMEVAGADIGRNIFFVPLDERKRQLEQIPWVEQAIVMRLLPNRIAVTLRERTPVAFAQIGPRTSLIDANGVVMGMPADRKTRYSFPVIRGIAETEALSSRAAAMKIYNRLVSELGADGAQRDNAGRNGSAGAGTSSSVNGGTNGVTNYVRQLSEVDLSDPEDVKVTANDPGGTMVVHLGAQDFLPRYKLYVTHIAEWRQQFQNVQSVDLRYEGQVIVNPDSRDREIGKSGDRVIGTQQKAVVTKPVSAKAVSHKATKPKKHLPQRTQRAQR